VTTPCTYNRVGEINADLRPMVYTQSGDSTLFSVDSDDAPTVYVNGTSAQPIRGQTDPIVRNLEREMGQLSWLNPYTGVVENNIMVALADHTGTGDPPHGHSRSVPYADLHAVRRSKLVLLRHHQCDPTGHVPDGGRMCIHSGADESKLRLEPGDIQDEIASTWVGYVGQGVDGIGIDSTTWSDHTDVRPTILELVGLKDDYVHDGRVISEILQGYAQPLALKKSSSFVALAQMYKQLNAPFGEFGMATLKASTKALATPLSRRIVSTARAPLSIKNRPGHP